MKVVTTRAELRAVRAEFPRLGLVPTMGYLHEGHLSLVRMAKQECGAAAVSIFVNPTQFGPGEDLSTYPRDLDRDLRYLREAGADLVWTPRVEDIYPSGFATTVTVGGITDVLEGARRPGHFTGVATVVAVLLGAVSPTRAYFGQKDAQQVRVIQRMATDLALPLDVVVGPTVRESDGLAMSSRNTYLSEGERASASVLYRALCAARAAAEGGEFDAHALRRLMAQLIVGEPMAEIDYVSVADPDSLAELATIDPARGALLSLAVRFGRTRLIDNVVLPPSR
ncbi:MAG: pantoate--beta-alanine ligase [Actinomycetales bacterium]|nr:pantoate--beta-alanine ligase [Actinomycetales bacterium]